MSLSVVQTKVGTSSNDASIDITFDSSTTSGNVIVVQMFANVIIGSAPHSTVTDNKGNQYGTCHQREEHSANNIQQLYSYWCNNITGGATHTLTVTVSESSANTADLNVIVYEVNSSAGVGAVMISRAATAEGSSTTPSSGNIITDETALFVGICNQANATSYVQQLSWTETIDSNQSSAAYIVQAAGTYDYAPTMVGLTGDWVAAVVAFVEVGLDPLMMRSQGNSPGANSTTCVVTKPENLAVGDLMIAQIFFREATITVTPPTGWNVIRETQSGTTRCGGIYWIIATSTETAASTFTWTDSGAGASNIGRITAYIAGSGQDFDTTTPILANNGAANDAGTETSGDITPSVANCTIMYFFHQSDDDGGAITAHAITTSDPSNWYQPYNSSTSQGADSTVTMAYTNPRPETTAIGNADCTPAVGNANIAQVIAIQPPVVAGGATWPGYIGALGWG